MAEKAANVREPQSRPAGGEGSGASGQLETGARQVLEQSGLDREGPSLATVALVGVGVAVLEPELIPGILIGAGAVLAPKILPALGGALRPLLKVAVKAGYSAAMSVREMAAEGREHMEDLMAEARAEHEASRSDGHSARKAEQQSAPEQPGKRPPRPSRTAPEGGAPPAARL